MTKKMIKGPKNVRPKKLKVPFESNIWSNVNLVNSDLLIEKDKKKLLYVTDSM